MLNRAIRPIYITAQRFQSQAVQKMTRQDVKEFVDSNIAKYPVAVFSKSYCPFCHKAKSALESFKEKYQPGSLEWVEIEKHPDVQEIQDYLNELTGGRTVPRVFIGGKFFGGGDDTEKAWKTGELEKRLKESGALL
uniref:Glutaredoxin domain-containing protein n=1 Tax=Acrobeloides nanus TaxID=290746 RepID=A0A914EJ16_9BILA